MGHTHSKIHMSDVKLFNQTFAKKPNAKKKYENIVYEYLFQNYRFMTQVDYFDFYLVDYHLYIELDEEHHFHSSNSVTRATHSTGDNDKNKACLLKPASLLRISWFSVTNRTFEKYIQKCLEKYTIGKLYLASKDIYQGLDMLNNIESDKLIFL